MTSAINFINYQIKSQNRNFVGIFVGRVGTGKSWSALRLAEILDPTFNLKRVVFRVEDLLELVHTQQLKPGAVIIFDEAGVGISNRQSYMNQFNKSIAFLLQTWRHRNLILFVTVPDIAFVDAGVRKLFDAIIECQKVMKKQKCVRASWKFIQVNPQSGKAYFHGLKTSMEVVNLEIGKPSIKLIHEYEQRKKEFTTMLYQTLKDGVPIKGKQGVNSNDIENIRRCKECGTLATWSRGKNLFVCRGCGNSWKKSEVVRVTA